MAEEHPLSVFVAENQRVADAVIALLASEGIMAQAVIRQVEMSSDPLTGVSEAPQGAGELDIRVADEKQLDAAKAEILKALEKGKVYSAHSKRATRTGTVTAVCEDCGHQSEWPATAMGTTEVCPKCGAYMDVPDPDEDWSDMDFGEEEGEEEAKE